jgi:glycosyltransferase involved in cell wall biosynthesis
MLQMKITVVCLTSRSGGGLTILQDLFTYATQVDKDNEWQFVISDQDLGTSTSTVEIVNTTPVYKGWRSRLWAEFFTGRRIVENFSPDFVLSLQNIDTPIRGDRPLALYVQQALPFQTDYKLSFLKRDERKLAWRQYLLKWPILKSVQNSVVTFVQTRWLAKRLKEISPKNRLVSIGHSHVISHGELCQSTQERDRFFYPASGSSYKNHRTLHLALCRLNKSGVNLTDRVSVTLTEEQLIKATGLSSDQELSWYRPLGWLSKEEVAREYANSILVFPSLVESLGLPLYEARNLGIPIVAGDTAFGKEALDGYSAVSWFDPKSPDSLAIAMKHSLESTQDNSTADKWQAQPQSPWERMIDEMQGALKESH